MATVLFAMTMLTSVFSLGVVAVSLRRGLLPLATLSREVARIDEILPPKLSRRGGGALELILK